MTADSGPSTLAIRIDDACERLESSWRAGRPLTLEQVMAEADVSADERPQLFRELFLLDAELRAASGETPPTEEYVNRFPEFAGEIAARIDSAEPWPEVLTLARYRIINLLAQGGLGRIFRARDELLDREMALKEIQAGRDNPTTRARFAREARFTSRLEHPGIVPVYALGCHPDGRPFYVMRLIRGESLREAIARYHAGRARGPRSMALRDLLGRFLDVCDAIEYAHSRGVLHRDLKPANIMLGPFGETLVVDWGLAKAYRPTGSSIPDGASSIIEPPPPEDADEGVFETAAGKVMGTPQFMSPEQASASHDEIGPASDIYSLGATLYDLLTGRPPFGDTAHMVVVVRRVAVGDFPRPRQVQPKTHRALEAICLKAMALRPEDRYPTALAMADDLRRWLADEPVSAWAEPWTVRARRWLGRHRVAAASAAGAVLVALLIGVPVVVQTMINEREAEVRARGRVAAIISARIEALPGLVEGVGADRGRVVRQLKTQFHVGPLDPKGRLRVALALGPIDPEIKNFLEARLLDGDLETLPQVCRALEGVDLKPIVARLWQELEADPGPIDRRFPAACALARLDPPRSPADDRRWSSRAAMIVAGCLEAIATEPSHFEIVVETFRPVRRALFETLAERFRDVPSDAFDPYIAARRTIAAALLDRYADRPDELASLIRDTLIGPRLGRYLDRLRALGEPAIAALIETLTRDDPVASSDAPDDPERAAGLRARRKARVAAALVALGRPEHVWGLLGSTADPTLRTELIHVLPGLGTAARRAIVDRLTTEADASTRRALILGLGSFPPDSIDPEFRRVLRDRLVDWYRRDPDPGVHGASGWLLRVRWEEAAALDRIDRELAGPDPAADRDWYVNSEGQTLAIVRGPTTVPIGSPPDEPGRDDSEARRTRRIDRSFAVATREVTVAEYRRILHDQPDPVPPLDDPEFRRLIRSDDAPIVGVSWFDAARYCNWLSRRDGIPESQWCYPTPIREGMRLDPALLDRSGYRLPTEAEWEHACRAGVATSRPFGAAWDWAANYGWFSRNAGGRLHSVGLKQPNDLGLFDALGNAAEWTLDRYRTPPDPLDPRQALPDAIASEEVTNQQSRVFRGGSILLPERPRSADRDASLPANRSPEIGFRVARTCR